MKTRNTVQKTQDTAICSWSLELYNMQPAISLSECQTLIYAYDIHTARSQVVNISQLQIINLSRTFHAAIWAQASEKLSYPVIVKLRQVNSAL